MMRIRRQRRAPSPPGAMPRIDPRRHEGDHEAKAAERFGASGLPRRDPHKDKGQRLRRELRTGRATVRIGHAERLPMAPQRIVLADDVPWIVVVSLPEEPWPDAERELLGTAHRVADEMGGGVVMVRVGLQDPETDFGQIGADRAVVLPPATDPDVLAAHVVAVMERFKARHVFFGEGGADADVARRTAILLGERPATSVHLLSNKRVTFQEAGGRTEVSRPLPRVATIAPGRFDAYESGVAREGRRIEMELCETLPGVRDLGVVTTPQLDAPLGEARFIVSAGDGVTDWEAFRSVAEALGGTIAGSRQVVDAGHLPRHRQVGASGTLVEARCYLAFGISGAPQHLQGVQRCRYVIAVNTDLHAAMVKRADLAIIADAQQVMPALARLAGGQTDG
ncbi:electron transfer flavoprotein subunit alpha/FixB family protein [Shinella sp. BYT-45]|uniref:electron transfer flavoprotein subunit alpha/FixB family protein n=1 Tax=Shinella sp. BYT-45 TaxID=3377377 RepID=UPI0039810B05